MWRKTKNLAEIFYLNILKSNKNKNKNEKKYYSLTGAFITTSSCLGFFVGPSAHHKPSS